MTIKASFALAASLGGALLIGAPARGAELTAMSGAYCAPGYHPDSNGNCQAINGIVDSRCPEGLEPHSAFNGNGYVCVPYGQGY